MRSGALSPLAVLGGVFTGWGIAATLLVVALLLAAAGDLRVPGLTDADWAGAGVGAASVVSVILLLAFLAGGLLAGRVAGADGLRHGLAVFAVAASMVAVAGVATVLVVDGETTPIWTDAGAGVLVAALGAVGVGSALGATRGGEVPVEPGPRRRAGARSAEEILADARARTAQVAVSEPGDAPLETPVTVDPTFVTAAEAAAYVPPVHEVVDPKGGRSLLTDEDSVDLREESADRQ